jgi:hypothetical protein
MWWKRDFLLLRVQHEKGLLRGQVEADEEEGGEE